MVTMTEVVAYVQEIIGSDEPKKVIAYINEVSLNQVIEDMKTKQEKPEAS